MRNGMRTIVCALNEVFCSRICRRMVHRLFRPLLAPFIAIALAGGPLAAQAAMPCHSCCDLLTVGHSNSGHLPAPCKNMAPACVGALTCLSDAALLGQRHSAVPCLSQLSAAYWPPHRADHGLTIEPGLDPPIAG
jgi:hypothetical protein